MLVKISIALIFLLPLTGGSRINDRVCDAQLTAFDVALQNREQWALFVFDTWAKFPSGISRGNRVIPGSFLDCVSFRQQINSTEGQEFQGKHCMVLFRPGEPASDINNENGFDWREIGAIARENRFRFTHGFCLPATCSEERVVEYMNGYLGRADFNGTSARCQTNDPIPFEPLDIFAIVFFSTIALLMVSSTLYEVLAIRNERNPHQLFSAFSVYTSGHKLYDVAISKSSADIRCLHGIRALSIIFIIFGHRYAVPLWFDVSNSAFVQEWQQRPYVGIYQTYQVAVDAFFLMGGLLVTMPILRKLETGRLNILRMYLHRFLRYTPLLAATILFFVTLMRFIVFSPFSYLQNNPLDLVPACEKWWWTTLLHVQNYVNPTEVCTTHAWYLSIDFQLFIISPFLLYPAWKFGWKYLWVLPTLALFSLIYIYVISLQSLDFNGYVRWVYYPTHARWGPWFIGMTLGYIMHQQRDRKVKINPTVNAVMWIVALSVFAAITMGAQVINLPRSVNNTGRHARALYSALFRNGWALATAWMVYAIHNGTGGIIRWFLQLPQWQPIGRMGLSMYLLGLLLQKFFHMSMKELFYFDEIKLYHEFWGDLLGSIFLSTIGYLAFEAPPLAIEKYFYGKIHEKRKNKN